MSKAEEIVEQTTEYWSAKSVLAAEQVVALERIATALEKRNEEFEYVTVTSWDGTPIKIKIKGR